MHWITTPAGICVQVFQRYFIWIICLSYFIAALRPEFGLWIRSTNLCDTSIFPTDTTCFLPQLMLGLILFNAGLGVEADELKHMLRKPLILVAGVFGNIATPLLFIVATSLAMTLWHNPTEVQEILVGLALVASMPIAGASAAWAQNADGDLALSLGLVLLTTMLSPVSSPAVLHAVGFVTTGDYSDDLHELASNGITVFLGTWVILPSLLGISIRRLLGERHIELLLPCIKTINYIVLILLNYANASLTLPGIISNPDIDFLAIMLVVVTGLCIATFASGYIVAWTCRVSYSESASLMFGLGMNNNGTALVLASLVLMNHPQVMIPIIFYNLIQHLAASLVDFSILRKRAA